MAEVEKGPPDKLIDWLSGWKVSFDRLRARFGMPVALLFILSVACGVIWWNWEEIAKRPGIERGVKFLDQQPLPTAPTGRVTIAVVHLDRDKDREHENLLLDELRSIESDSAEVERVDRIVEWPNAQTEGIAKAKAEEEARDLLKQIGADVLIWGYVERLGDKSAMLLYWTPRRHIPGVELSEKYPTETIALPSVFWDDLKQVLGLLIQARITEITIQVERSIEDNSGPLDQSGRYVADRLAPLIAQVRSLVQSKQGVWNPETLTRVQFSLAVALKLEGEQSGKTEPLNESVELYRKVLMASPRERVPLDWALTQNNLGDALETLGEWESGTARLEEAVSAYRAAVQERTRERVPLDWAQTQTNLGNALEELGERESGTEKLKEAVTAYRAALEERTRERVPLDWAETQTDLAIALKVLGERENGTEKLEQAVAAYRAALEEQTRERVPLDWALTQNNLGNALRRLGERESGTARLEEAVQAYRAALEERTRERVPLRWAATQANLGNAFLALGERENGTARLEKAVDAYKEALEEDTRERVPLAWGEDLGNQGVALMIIAQRTNDASVAERAVEQIKTAYETEHAGGQVPWAAFYEQQLPKAQAVRDRLKGK
jgi:tetratricopeptide (TPR) repeat protein